MGGLLALAFAAGMVAPVNPCGFALLPAWITLSLGDSRKTSLPVRLTRAIRSAVALTVGFAGTLVAVGLLVSAGAHALIKAAPWLGLATGLILLALALVMLTGHSLGLRLPGFAGRPVSRGSGLAQSVTYGVGFAAASLSCTFGVLLAVIAQAQTTATFTGLLVVFAAYAAGAATILLLVAIATGFAGTALTRRAARLARYGPTLTAAVLALTGAYLVWYWYPTTLSGGTTARTGGLTVIAATISTWVQAHPTLIATLAVAAVLVGAVAGIRPRYRRRVTRSPTAASTADPECCATEPSLRPPPQRADRPAP